ncbi:MULTISPECIES: glycosyltransferase family 2 protein [Rhodobacterales]|uniref:glycosyltransferase family 2 protein n=1 Tax=Rhodobacterales TaxID=204455 RepID=UPI003298661E
MTDSQNPSLTEAELTVIVISYNTRDMTLTAIRSLYETTKNVAINVVVFDNASSDGSAEAVAEAFPQARVIASPDNLGFAKANNVVASEVETEWLLLLNPDTECHPGAVDNLMAFAQARPQAGIWGGRTVFPDGSLNIASCWMRITPWSLLCRSLGLSTLFPKSELLNSEAIGGWQRDTVREVDIVVGCFLLIKRSLWNELDGFDLRYFMYGEEADLCLRAAKQGYRPAITPDAQIMHVVGAASKTRGDKILLVTKARATLVRDHWPAALVPLGLVLMWIAVGVRTLGLGLLAKLRGGRWVDRATAQTEVWRARRDWLVGY